MSTNPVRGVLFDLDGTLLDTIPDLVFALNKVRTENGLPELPISAIRPIATLGSRAMVKIAFGIELEDPKFDAYREHFMNLYEKHLADSTRFFPNMENVLEHLENNNIPWGIVTNKLTRHTVPLLKALEIDHRPGCVVCGDSLPTFKPDPEPILHACRLIKQDPAHCIYVGDAETDVTASKAAGTKSLVALYGYIHEDEDPYAWKADGYVQEPIELIKWFNV